ncbi:MAG: leucyl/phenylalanyl-tRNA--protein transferase [Alphaproteobacteria bacterium]
MQLVLTSAVLIEAYKQGLFPMAYSAGSPFIHWVCPEMRGQLSIPDLHISKSLKKEVNKALKNPDIEIKIDSAFEDVIRGCAQENASRPETWINEQIIEAFTMLHENGYAHSVEYWKNSTLQGGLYGLKIGGLFCGESMFSRTSNASKICLVHLAARLWKGGFQILDTQFTNDHLEQFGVYEIPHKTYVQAIKKAASLNTDWELQGISEQILIQDYFEMKKAGK